MGRQTTCNIANKNLTFAWWFLTRFIFQGTKSTPLHRYVARHLTRPRNVLMFNSGTTGTFYAFKHTSNGFLRVVPRLVCIFCALFSAANIAQSAFLHGWLGFSPFCLLCPVNLFLQSWEVTRLALLLFLLLYGCCSNWHCLNSCVLELWFCLAVLAVCFSTTSSFVERPSGEHRNSKCKSSHLYDITALNNLWSSWEYFCMTSISLVTNLPFASHSPCKIGNEIMERNIANMLLISCLGTFNSPYL